jgi:Ca-activated chloride channel family protein
VVDRDRQGSIVRVRVVALATLLQNQMTSIGFDNPYMLLLIPVTLPILAVLFLKSSKRFKILSLRLGSISRSRFIVITAIVKILIPILTALTASQPYIVSYTTVNVTIDNVLDVNTTSARIAILLDISRSMGYSELSSTRFSTALGIVEKIVGLAIERKDIVDIRIFSDTVKPLCLGINNESYARECIERLRGADLEKFSAIGDALIIGYSVAKASAIPIAVVVVTDGAINYGSPVEDAVDTVANSGIAVVIIIIGNDPRSLDLEKLCRDRGLPVFRVGYLGDEEAVKYVSEKLYAKARFEALKVSGNLNIATPVKDYSIQLYLLIVLVILIAVSMAEGV